MAPRRIGASALALAAVFIAASGGGAASSHVLYTWTELAPTGIAPSGLIARAVTDGAACPVVVLRGAGVSTLAMRSVAPAPGIVGFSSVRACRASLPGRVTRATIVGRRLPLLGSSGKIALIGDTGCAIPKPGASGKQKAQDCNDPVAGWPFAAIAARVAGARPDVVIHMGDYIYREAGCTTTVSKRPANCNGSPAGNPAGSPNPDNWAIWEADFFKPAAPFLAVAPIVTIRGNHELCSRAGNGYFLLLDPGPSSARTCGDIKSPDVTPPYGLDVHGLRLVVADTSGACDFDALRTNLYAPMFAHAARLAHGPTWLLSHRPLFGYVNGKAVEPGEAGHDVHGCTSDSPATTVWKSVELQTAASGLGRYSAILSGHVHAFETVQLAGRPGQLIVGNGGTKINGGLTKNPVPPSFGPGSSPAPTWAGVQATFGYAIVTPAARGGWTLRARSVTGALLATCPFGAAPLRCS
jgi:hypothetical protein